MPKLSRLQRDALLVELVDSLRDNGSWAGETHVQKAAYLLEELFSSELDFEFVLYKHGPYSFDLSDELSAMMADNFIALEQRPDPYGPSLRSTESGESLKERFPSLMSDNKSKIEFIAKNFGDKQAKDLERLATAYYVSQNEGLNKSDAAERVNRLKPHISVEEALEALKSIEAIKSEAST